MIGFLTLHFVFEGENITDRPVLANASYVWLATIPIYITGLLFFHLFYTKAHVWKSNGVVVGYHYIHKDENQEKNRIGVDQEKRTCVCCFTPCSKEENQNVQIPKWQQNLIGHWVNHDENGL